MEYINLTPHCISIYTENQFVGLKQINPTTWVADSVEGHPVLDIPSRGCARISVDTEENVVNGLLIAHSTYGDAVGLPNKVDPNNVLVVSLPMQSMAKASRHPLAAQMVAPYKVVRSADNGSIVLGAMGFTY